MRTTGALLFSHRGLALFLIIITVRVLFLFSASRPCSPRILPGNHRANYREGEDHTPKEQGMLIWRSGNIHEKASTGPHSLHIFLVPGHTHTATASDYSGRFPPSTGTQDEGGKNTIIRYHTHRTIHMSTTSRDAIPQGRTKTNPATNSTKDSFASMAQKYYYL